MEKIAMILRRAPYGDINAAEAVRHAMGGVAEDLEVSLILLDSGVNLVKRGQDVPETDMTHLENALRDCIDMGVVVYVDKASVREQHLDSSELVEGTSLASSLEIAELIQDAETVMIF